MRTDRRVVRGEVMLFISKDGEGMTEGKNDEMSSSEVLESVKWAKICKNVFQ